MKILHLIFTMKTGGTESMLVDIANEQLRMGHDVSVLIINRGSEPELLAQFDSGINLIEIGRKLGSRNPMPVLQGNLAVLRLNPDVIHVHNERGVNFLLPSLRRKVIQTVHTTGIELTGCQTRTPLVAISNAVADDLRLHCGLSAEVVMNGINTSAIDVKGNSATLKKLICVGRMDMSVKGQDLLLRALVQFPEMTLTLIGDGTDMLAAKQMAAKFGVDSRVEFMGKMGREDIYKALKNYDAFVMPSRQEGFGLVLAEAMAAGLPVVTSALPGPLEVIDGGRLGFTFEPDSDVSLVEALKELSENWSQAQNLALTDGRKFVSDNFSVATTAARYVALYEKLKLLA